jgi:tRNA pseudouridine55 synthase
VIDGALLLDKPAGLSSNAALQQARRALGARKAGHAGTLDPLATGLLVMVFGEATKFAGSLLDQDKEYLATVRLGEQRSTGDAEGEVLATGPQAVDAGRIPEALASLTGAIEQVPPMYSALKRGGVPLYALARQGETVERAPRRVEIKALEALRYEPPYLEVRVACSKGTYVRTLAEDLAARLGTVAYLTALRRTRSGTFRIDDACTLGELQELEPPRRLERLLPLHSLLSGLPSAQLDPASELRFRNGQVVPIEGVDGLCAVYSCGGRVIGIGHATQSALRPVRLTASQAAESP